MDFDARCELTTTVCRHSVSNAREAQALFGTIGIHAYSPVFRTLIIIETTFDAGAAQWRSWTAEYLKRNVVVMDELGYRDRSDELTQILGSEYTTAVYARAFDAGLFASLAGTVRHGGVFIWITSPLDKWAAISRYGRRLVALLDVIPTTPAVSDIANAASSSEQDELLATLRKVCDADGNAVAVLVGKRGRGKSTLLGRLAASLASSGDDFLITASYRGAINSATKAADECELTFVASDQVLQRSASILLVDEAANISLDLLKQWVLHYPKVILATTIEGYESAGRSFSIRFAQWLEHHRPGWCQLEPVCPWRWDAGDPLERFIDNLLLSTEPPILTAPDKLSEAPTFKQVSQDQLASDDQLLQTVYALLRAHHYQTSVLDLQHLLDAKNLAVFMATISGQCVAASLVAIEGELDGSLHEAIVAKERRIAHQLLPQLLAQTANQTTALDARYARVMRIAVTPAWRRRKIASGLLKFIETTLSNSVDIVGASFADTEAAKAFWLRHDYLIVHQGYRQNPRSGARSLAVLKSFDSGYEGLLQSAHRLYLDNHHGGADDTLQINDDPHLSDRAILERLVRGQRNVHDSLGAIRRLVRETPDNALWLEQLYAQLGCRESDSQRKREKKLRLWLSEQTIGKSAS